MHARVVADLFGRPSAILEPKSRTTTLSEIAMTIAMWCSTSSTLSSKSVADRAHELRQLVDLGVGEPGRGLVEQQQLRACRERRARSRPA